MYANSLMVRELEMTLSVRKARASKNPNKSARLAVEAVQRELDEVRSWLLTDGQASDGQVAR